jgi:hypothetical protein
MIASLILIVIAAVCNAMMDVLSHHWYKFRWRGVVDRQWWDPSKSWENKYINRASGSWWIPVQFSDGWHTFKTVMIFALMGAVVSFESVSIYLDLALFCIYGVVWNLVFGLCYRNLFVK